MRVDNLKIELKFYEEHRDFLCEYFLDKFVLIKKKKIVGVYKDFESALENGINKLGITSMFIRKIAKVDEIIYLYNVA